jgi:hypothetical protein
MVMKMDDRDKQGDKSEQDLSPKPRENAERLQGMDPGEKRFFLKARHGIYYILGVIEVLLGFRLLFKLLGASTASSFVSGLYAVTNVLSGPFAGIFRTASAKGAGTQFVLEPGTIIAMLVYAVIAMGLVNLVRLRLVGQE